MGYSFNNIEEQPIILSAGEYEFFPEEFIFIINGQEIYTHGYSEIDIRTI